MDEIIKSQQKMLQLTKPLIKSAKSAQNMAQMYTLSGAMLDLAKIIDSFQRNTLNFKNIINPSCNLECPAKSILESVSILEKLYSHNIPLDLDKIQINKNSVEIPMETYDSVANTLQLDSKEVGTVSEKSSVKYSLHDFIVKIIIVVLPVLLGALLDRYNQQATQPQIIAADEINIYQPDTETLCNCLSNISEVIKSITIHPEDEDNQKSFPYLHKK